MLIAATLGIYVEKLLRKTQITDMAKAVAFAEGRDYIVPRDVQNIFICTVNHRIILNAKASASKKNSEEILHEILRKTPKPRT